MKEQANTIRIGRSLQKQIRAAVNERLGYRARQEVGQRVNMVTEETSYNASLWVGITDHDDTDPDLFDHQDLSKMARIDIQENASGVVELDIYCYFPKGHVYEYDLDQNMHAYIKHGELLEILCEHEEIMRAEQAAQEQS